MRFQADEIRQLVDAFLADHGGIHVGPKMLTGKRRRSWRGRLGIVGGSSPPPRGISTATSSNSQCAGPGEGRMARAPSTSVLSSAGSAGLQMRVATRDI